MKAKRLFYGAAVAASLVAMTVEPAQALMETSEHIRNHEHPRVLANMDRISALVETWGLPQNPIYAGRLQQAEAAKYAGIAYGREVKLDPMVIKGLRRQRPTHYAIHVWMHEAVHVAEFQAGASHNQDKSEGMAEAFSFVLSTAFCRQKRKDGKRYCSGRRYTRADFDPLYRKWMNRQQERIQLKAKGNNRIYFQLLSRDILGTPMVTTPGFPS